MLAESLIAGVLAACLALFCFVNVYNLGKFRAYRGRTAYSTTAERPGGFVFALTAFGTLFFFLESVLYVVLVLTGLEGISAYSLFQLHFPYDSHAQIVGLLMTVLGYALFVWSVLARGRYATSWDMPENHKLVTWGPYSYVRHPSYLAYIILFVALFLTTLNAIATIPLVAIPGYLRIADREEEMLTAAFGKAYMEYQRTTGKFIPKRKPERGVSPTEA